MNHVPPRFFGGLAFAPAFASRLPSFIARLKGNREFWTRTRWLGDLDSNQDYRSQSRFPGPMVSADSAPHLSPTITIALPWTAPSFAAVKGIIHAPGAFAPHLPVAPYHSGDRRWRSAQPRQGAALFQDPAGARSHETPRLSEPVGKNGVQ